MLHTPSLCFRVRIHIRKTRFFKNNSDFLFSNILTILDDFGRLRVIYHFQSRRLVMTQGGVYSGKIQVWNRQNSVASTENSCLFPSLDQTAYHVMLLLLRDGDDRQACSPLIQLFFGFASDIGQTNIYRDIRDGNWLSISLLSPSVETKNRQVLRL